MAQSADTDRHQREGIVAPGLNPAARQRVDSVDALRGLTILLMVFVNDLGDGSPSWMRHIQPPRADGMTLADVVFPMFLFIVGVSIPLALERARDAGKSKWAQLGHILIRTAALLVMGVITLNADGDRTLGGPLWNVLAFTALLLAWCMLPREPGLKRKVLAAVKACGAVGLLILLVIYRREPATVEIPFRGQIEGWMWLRIGWWGILGLIGWAYLTAGVLTLLLGKRREWLMGALALLIVLHLAMEKGGLFRRVDKKPWVGAFAPTLHSLARVLNQLDQYVSLGHALGSLAAVSMAGCLLGAILRRDSDVNTHRDRIRWCRTFVIGLLLAGFFTDTFEGINKNGSTPTWCLWSAAIACTVWAMLYLIMDMAGWRRWSILIRPAGANPLVAYFLHPILVELIGLANLEDTLLSYKNAADPWIVVGGSLGMAVFVCAATGLLGRIGLRTRL